MRTFPTIKLGHSTTLQKKEDRFTGHGFMVSELFGVCASGDTHQEPEDALREVINRIKPYNKPGLPEHECLLCGQLTTKTDHITREVMRDERHFHKNCWRRWKLGERNER